MSADFVKGRGIKTISAAQQIAASWTWQEKTIPQMQAALVAIIVRGTIPPTPPPVPDP